MIYAAALLPIQINNNKYLCPFYVKVRYTHKFGTTIAIAFIEIERFFPVCTVE